MLDKNLIYILFAGAIFYTYQKVTDKYLGIPVWGWLVILAVVYWQYTKNEKFADVKDNKKQIKVYNFNTRWCGWSKRFQKDWDDFMNDKDVKTMTHVVVKDIKCDDEANDEMCSQYNVPGFPYVVFEVDGKVNEYNGERTTKALKASLDKFSQ